MSKPHEFFFVSISLLWLFYRSVREYFLRVTWRTLFFSRRIFPYTNMFLYFAVPREFFNGPSLIYSYNSQLQLVKEIFAHALCNQQRPYGLH